MSYNVGSNSLPSIVGPVLPIGQTAQYISPKVMETYQSLEDYPERLAALQTTIMYIAPNNDIFHLNGPLAGKEGVRIGEMMQGDRQFPFEQVLIESAFQRGTTVQRTNLLKREISCRITIGNTRMPNYTYRMCEDRFWSGQDERQPGWLGVFTRATGWRWTAVWPHKTVDTALKQDPVAYGNNFAVWDLYWLAELPYYNKPATNSTWRAAQSGAKDANGYYTGTLVLANRGDLPTYASYLVDGSGLSAVQDNYSDRMVPLPEIYDSDGTVMVSTEPDKLTVLAENDPQDNEFYKITRSAGLLNFFLSGVVSRTEPIWKRRYTRFLYQIPPHTAVHLDVKHSNINASITAFVPQRFRRSW